MVDSEETERVSLAKCWGLSCSNKKVLLWAENKEVGAAAADSATSGIISGVDDEAFKWLLLPLLMLVVMLTLLLLVLLLLLL